MNNAYFYVVARDFGFAPNPFHGFCTLATCKPKIRAKAGPGDWVVGMGGRRLEATGRCVFAMRVTARITFNQYWSDPKYIVKRPIRNGSLKTLVGDNIYHFNSKRGAWEQADSHHSNSDGTPNIHNVTRDTQSDRVLISDHFFYFGSAAPEVPLRVLEALGYKNGRAHRVFAVEKAAAFFGWLAQHKSALNRVVEDPFDFERGEQRYSVHNNQLIL